MTTWLENRPIYHHCTTGARICGCDGGLQVLASDNDIFQPFFCCSKAVEKENNHDHLAFVGEDVEIMCRQIQYTFETSRVQG